MTAHPKEAVEAVTRAIQAGQVRSLTPVDQAMRIVSAPDKKADAIDAALALLDQIAPMLTARAEADKAAAVEAAAQIAQDESAKLLAKADRVKVVAGDLYRHHALIVAAQVAANIAAAIREAPQ